MPTRHAQAPGEAWAGICGQVFLPSDSVLCKESCGALRSEWPQARDLSSPSNIHHWRKKTASETNSALPMGPEGAEGECRCSDHRALVRNVLESSNAT